MAINTAVTPVRSVDRGDNSDHFHVGLVKASPSPSAATSWLDGDNSTFRLYNSGEPDDDYTCFAIKGDSDGKMVDMECSDQERYICKISYGQLRLTSSLYTVYDAPL